MVILWFRSNQHVWQNDQRLIQHQIVCFKMSDFPTRNISELCILNCQEIIYELSSLKVFVTDVISEAFFFLQKISIGCYLSWKFKKDEVIPQDWWFVFMCLFSFNDGVHSACIPIVTCITVSAFFHCYSTVGHMVIIVKILVPHLYQQCMARPAPKEAQRL